MDNVQDVRDWYKKTVVADFFVRATTPDMSTGLAADIPDEVDGEIRDIPGIVSLDPVRLVAAKAADQQVVLIIRSFEDPKLQEFEVVEGDEKTVRESLKQGDAVIGSVLAERTKLKAGEKISLTTDEGVKDFNIAAVVNDYQAGGLTMYLARDVAKAVLGIGGVDAYAIQVDHAQLATVREALDDLTQEHGLLLQSFSDIQQTIDGMMAGVVAGLWGMVVLGLLVAAFGVANTLTMSVLEQTFELGLLRIVASTRASSHDRLRSGGDDRPLGACAGNHRRRERRLSHSPGHAAGDRPPGGVRGTPVAAGRGPCGGHGRGRSRRVGARRKGRPHRSARGAAAAMSGWDHVRYRL